MCAHPRVLLIDDDPLMRRIISQTLDSGDTDIIEAENGPSGIETALEAHPDLILLDVMMSGMDGFEVCYQLRRHPTTSAIPIIMLTALGDMTEKIRGMNVGADDYITKPFDPRELRARVQAHLRRSIRDQQANPLTHLPGNNAIEQIIEARLVVNEPLAVLYIDLGNFKAYNDKYGWLAGDDVIRMLGRIVVQVTLERGGKDDFVGHIGGDDFVVITTPVTAEILAETIIKQFDKEVLLHYNEEDRAQGFIEGIDRQGNPMHVPVTSLSVAVVTNDTRPLTHPGQVAQIAAELKTYAKKLPGSQYVFDRRKT
ncbi:MAG TPA: response regulator [Anaerolineae bacterium]